MRPEARRDGASCTECNVPQGCGSACVSAVIRP